MLSPPTGCDGSDSRRRGTAELHRAFEVVLLAGCSRRGARVPYLLLYQACIRIMSWRHGKSLPSRLRSAHELSASRWPDPPRRTLLLTCGGPARRAYPAGPDPTGRNQDPFDFRCRITVMSPVDCGIAAARPASTANSRCHPGRALRSLARHTLKRLADVSSPHAYPRCTTTVMARQTEPVLGFGVLDATELDGKWMRVAGVESESEPHRELAWSHLACTGCG